MKMQMLAVLALLICAQFVFADVIPSDSHMVNRCVRITNLDEFPDVYLIAFVTGPMLEGHDAYLIGEGACLNKGYKFNSLSVYWAPKGYVDGVGLEGIKIGNVSRRIPGGYEDNGLPAFIDVEAFDDQTVHFIPQNVGPFSGWTPNSNPITSENITYSVKKTSDYEYVLEKIEGTLLDTEKPSQTRGLFESIICFLSSLFGGKC